MQNIIYKHFMLLEVQIGWAAKRSLGKIVQILSAALDFRKAESQPEAIRSPYGSHSSASSLMPRSCPCQLPGSCSPQMGQGKAETGIHIFHTCILLFLCWGKECVCVDVAGESRAALTALQILMDAQIFRGVSKIQGSGENTKCGCATVSVFGFHKWEPQKAVPVCLQVRIAQRQDGTQGQQTV